MKHLLLPILFTSTLTLSTHASPIAKYGDDATPYPLYAIEFGTEFPIDEPLAETLSQNFDAYFGSIEVPALIAQYTKNIDPDFNYIRYVGRWTVGSEGQEKVENGQRDQVLHYLLGNLDQPIGAQTTQFSIANLYGSLPANESLEQAEIWLRIDEEWMRLLSSERNTVTVQRAWDGSVAASHSREASILAPVTSSRDLIRHGKIALRHDSGSRLRWQEILDTTLEHHAENEAATWIDILMGNFASYTLGGETVSMDSGRQWNFHEWRPYDEAALALETERAVTWIQNRYRDSIGQWPILWANNMEFPLSLDSPRLQLLLPSEHEPRPLDGFAMENMYAHWGYGGGSGKNFMWVPEGEWIEHLQSLMLMGELKVNARPLMFDGGIDNLKFAKLPTAERERLILYGYASYLMGVKVEADDSIHTKLGSCPIVMDGDTPSLHIYDTFTWDIGRPTQTRSSSDALSYRIPGTSVFLRSFENGYVLVNPSDSQAHDVPLADSGKAKLFNPATGEVKAAPFNLGPRTGLILLKSK